MEEFDIDLIDQYEREAAARTKRIKWRCNLIKEKMKRVREVLK